MSERERERYYAHYAHYDKHYRESSKEHRYKESKHRSKYDKYGGEKYYEHHRSGGTYPPDYKRSAKDVAPYEKLHKLSKPCKEYEKYENVYDHRDSPITEHSRDQAALILSPHHDKHRHSEPAESEKMRSKSRPRDEQYLVDRISKRKRSKSPGYHNSPATVEPPKTASPKIGSATSHDTGYASISPLPASPPKPELDMSAQSDNPYGCARAVPRKHISKVKVIGLKSEVADLSSSSMSLEEESGGEEKMRVEDISPNTTPKQAPILLPPPLNPEPPPLLPDLVPPIPLIAVPLPPVPTIPVQYQAGQWLHTTYPDVSTLA